jgi:hypothetical protein
VRYASAVHVVDEGIEIAVVELSDTAFNVASRPSWAYIACTRLTIATASSFEPCSAAATERLNIKSATDVITAIARTIEALLGKDE